MNLFASGGRGVLPRGRWVLAPRLLLLVLLGRGGVDGRRVVLGVELLGVDLPQVGAKRVGQVGEAQVRRLPGI